MNKKSLGAGLLTILAIVTVVSFGESFKAKNPWPYILLGGLAMAGAKKVYEDDDLVDFEHIDAHLYDFVTTVTGEVVGMISRGVSRSAKGKPARIVKELVMQNIPPSIGRMIQQRYSQQLNWIESYLRGHHLWICGKSGGGKTHLALLAIGKQFDADPRTIMRICDRNFGAPIDKGKGKKGKANDWLGAPLDCIAKTETEIIEAVRWTAEELRNREAECQAITIHNREGVGLEQEYPDYPQILLVIDELDQTQAPINRKYKTEDGEGELTYHLEYIAKIGRKYKVKLLLVGQSLQVGATDIPQSARAQFSICMLGSNVFSPNEVKEFLKGNSEELIAEAHRVQKSGIGRGPAIVALSPEDNPSNDFPVVRPVPETAITFQFVQVKSADREWWDSAWTEHGDWVVAEINRWAAGERNSPKGEICKIFGVKQSGEDPRYQNFVKPMMERIEITAKDATKVATDQQLIVKQD